MATSVMQMEGLDETAQQVPCKAGPAGAKIKKVLLIEDSEDSALLVEFALAEYGKGKYKLEWAKCLTEGLSRIVAGGIDIILLDLGLPESSGALSYSWVRETASELPVVVLTGDSREETELSVFSSGVDDYLVKDQVSGSLLVTAIEEALGKTAKRDHAKALRQQITKRFPLLRSRSEKP